MENIMFKSKEELVTIAQTLVSNHEKIKQEMVLLYELMTQVEKDYVEVMAELKNRE